MGLSFHPAQPSTHPVFWPNQPCEARGPQSCTKPAFLSPATHRPSPRSSSGTQPSNRKSPLTSCSAATGEVQVV